MNSYKRRRLKEQILARDGSNCYICNKPWHEGMTDEQVMAVAQKHGLPVPASLNGTKYQWVRSQSTLSIHVLVLEHKDNLKGDEISNLRLAHQSCNIRKDPAGHPPKRNFLKHFEKRSMNGGMDEKEITKVEFKTLQRNIEMEPRFVHAGNQLLTKYGTVPLSEFIPAACQDAKSATETISPATGQRYFSKYANPYAKTAIWEVVKEDIPEIGKVGMVRMKGRKS